MRMYDFHATRARTAEEALAQWRAVDEGDRLYGGIPVAWGAAQLTTVRDTGDPVAHAELDTVLDGRVDALEARAGEGQLFEAFALYRPVSADERRVQATVEVSAEQLQAAGYLLSAVDDAAEALAASLIEPGEFFNGSQTQAPSRNEGYLGWAVRPRYETVRRESASPVQTRYFVMERGGGFMPPWLGDAERWDSPEFAHFEHALDWHGWDAGHLTYEAAQAQLAALLDRPSRGDGDLHKVYNIVAQTRREDGTPLETAARVIVGASADVELTFIRRGENPIPDGWYIYTVAEER